MFFSRLKTLCIGFVIVFWIVSITHAYSPNIRFETVSLEQGLSQSVVQSIAQDSTGFLWFGTQDGLNRYDGYGFKIYRNSPVDSASLSDNLINTLYVDRKGRLWIGTISGGVCRYDDNTDTFIRYRNDPGDPNSLAFNSVLQIYDDHKGDLWLLSFGQNQVGLNRIDGTTDEIRRYAPNADSTKPIQGNIQPNLVQDNAGMIWFATNMRPPQAPTNYHLLRRLDPKTDQITTFPYQPADPGGVSDTVFSTVLTGKAGRVWIGTQNGRLITYEPTTQRFVTYIDTLANARTAEFPFPNNINQILEDRHGLLWCSTTNAGLLCFDPQTEKFERYVHDSANPHSLGHNSIFQTVNNFNNSPKLFEDSQGYLWVVDQAGGIDVLTPDRRRFIRYRNNPNLPHTLDDNGVGYVFEDRSKTIWVSIYGSGLNKFNRSREKFARVQNDPQTPNSLADNLIWSFFEDEAGHVWIGSPNGLTKWNRATNAFTVYRHDPADPRSIPSHNVIALCPDQLGIFWIGAQGMPGLPNAGGLIKLNQKTGEFTRYATIPNDSTSLAAGGVNSLLKDSDGVLWAGSNGLNRFNREKGTFKRYQNDPKDSTSISGNAIVDLMEDSQKTIWLGFNQGRGLNRYNRETDNFTRFLNNPKDPQSLSHSNVMCMYEDKAGNFWVGTWGGLNLMNRANGKFKAFTTKDGLPNDAIYGILEDDDGNLWLSTNNGICRFDPKTRQTRNYSVDDGLQSNEFNQGAFYKLRDGTMLFGGINGFNIFHPNDIKDNDFLPPVTLTGFKIFEKPVNLGIAITKLDNVAISYKENFFAFEFAALDFANPPKNQYAYMLEGFDTEWHNCGNRRFVSYTNLDGGDYVFRVKGTNSDGLWNEKGLAVKLKVIPPFWKTWWFYVLEVISAIVLIAGGFLYQQYRHKKELEFKRKSAEINFARQIQLSMLPTESIVSDKLEIYGQLITATEIGGDYYDFVPLINNRYYVAIGDATGHGAAAGLFVGMIKMSSLYAIQMMNAQSKLNQLVADLNVALRRSLTQRGMGMCFCLSILDMKNMTVDLCSAGMPYPYHFSQERQQITPLVMKGPPLGFFKRIDPQTANVALKSGDVLIYLTDGFEERFDPTGETWGDEALEAELLSACRTESNTEAIAQRLIRGSDVYAKGRPNDDDMTLVVVKIK